HRCDLGRCVPGCANSTVCSSGEQCLAGRCLLLKPSVARTCLGEQDCASHQQCVDSRLLASLLNQGTYANIDLRNLSLPLTDRRRFELGQIEDKSRLNLPIASVGMGLLPPMLPELSGHLFLSLRFSGVNNDEVQNRDTKWLGITLGSPMLSVDDVQRFGFNNLAALEGTTGNSQRFNLADLRGLTTGINRKTGWKRVYVASRVPPAVFVYDIQPDSVRQTVETQLIETVPLDFAPAHMVYRERPAPLHDLLYVVCSRLGRVFVIDAETFQILYRIPVGEQPYFMTLYEPRNADDLQQRRAYVANFLDSTVTIIDLDTHQVVGLVKGLDTQLKVDF
ncbi:MAG: hypothetical protein AAGJ35_14670, partial [Myxococcota bacterium]